MSEQNAEATDPPTRVVDPAAVPRWMEVFGWYGTAAILIAYGGNSLELIDGGLVYQLLNLTGAAGVGLVCHRRRTWQPFWLELVWGCIAVVALIRMAAN